MKKRHPLKHIFVLIAILAAHMPLVMGQSAESENTSKATPLFKDGEAQIIEAFNTPDKWLRHDLWVQTDFDSDLDGKMDRVHVDVTRPFQTDTEGLKLPIVYISSPYFAGTAPNGKEFMWDVRHELGATPPKHVHPEVTRTGKRPIISN